MTTVGTNNLAAEVGDEGASNGPLLLSKDDAARALGISIRQLERIMQQQKIEFVRVGRLIKFTRAHLARYVGYLESLESDAAGAA